MYIYVYIYIFTITKYNSLWMMCWMLDAEMLEFDIQKI